MTVKTLRHYHNKGVLIPSYVNKDNGYRFYSEMDLERAKIIAVLKELKFSLSEIEAFLKDMNDDADVINALKEKKAKLDSEIKSLKTASSAMRLIIQKESEARKVTDSTSKIEIKVVPEQLVVAFKWEGPYSDTGKAMGKIYRAGGRQSAGPALNLCYDGEYRDIASMESCLPIKKTVKTNLACRVLPQQKCVSLVHKGPYENLGTSYKALFDYMAESGLTMSLPTREVYIKGPGMIFKGNPDNYLTELLIPFE